MARFLSKLKELALRPFRYHFLFLVSFFVLATSPDVIRQAFFLKQYMYAVILFVHCFVVSYVVTFIVGLIGNNLLRKIVQTILLIVFAVLFAMNIYCIFELGGIFDKDYALLVLETNPNEAREFASTMLPVKTILEVVLVYAVLITAWLWSRKHDFNLGKRASVVALVLVLLGALYHLYNKNLWPISPVQRFIEYFQHYDVPSDLQSYYTHPEMTSDHEFQKPENVILIIGESFARFHSSLFGYEKMTNPRLGALRDQGLLFKFDSIDAPAPTTALALRYMLSLYDKSCTDKEKKWYEYTSLIEMMKSCGYDCYWFSTQARGGIHDGTARVYAEACEQSWFLQKPGTSLGNNKTLDIELVTASHGFVDTIAPGSHNFVVYHMMGSHFGYNMRYPAEYDKFQATEYSKYPEHQRAILAAYDNSLLYNDFVVDSLISLYRDKESVIIYIPDHGQDLFRSSPNYCVHGKENNPVSYAYGVEVPFMIYLSPMYQQRHPQVVERAVASSRSVRPWNTEDLPYCILDLIGVTVVDNQDVRQRSVLTGNQN